MWSLIPTAVAPFGPLQPLHEYALAHAMEVAPSNLVQVLLIPTLPFGVQIFLLQYDRTRMYRIAAAAVGCTLMLRAWMSYRFTAPQHQALNELIGVLYLHLIAKSVEFAAIPGKLVDPYTVRGRPMIVSAFDSAINSRWIGLDGMEKEQTSRLEGKTSHAGGTSPSGQQEGQSSSGSASRAIVSSAQLRYLPKPQAPKPRLSAIFYHSGQAVNGYLILDSFLSLLRYYGRTTISLRQAPAGAFHAFLYDQQFSLLPSTLGIPVPPVLVRIAIVLFVGTGIWKGLEMGWHAAAALSLSTGLWEPESWDVPFFAAPWKADSLLDFWGRRWHQVFRHHFLLTGHVILKTLGIPPSNALLLPISFLLSGLLHAVASLTMFPPPRPLSTASFFIFSGLGCFLEVAFKKATGKKVHGIAGRIWVWAFLITSAQPAVSAWFDGASLGKDGIWHGGGRLGCCELLPPGGPGEKILPYVAKYLIGVKA